MNLQLDNKKSYRRMYHKETLNKIGRMRKYYEKVREGKRKLAEENRRGQFVYSPRMSGPFSEDHEQSDSKHAAKKRRINPSTDKHCPKCGKLGHMRANSLKCLKNLRNMKASLPTLDNEARAKGKSKTIRMQHVTVYVPHILPGYSFFRRSYSEWNGTFAIQQRLNNFRKY